MPSRHSSHHRVTESWRLSDGSVTWGALWMGGPHRLPGPRPSLPSNSQRCSGSRPSPGPHRWAGCSPRSSASLTAWVRRCCLRWGCWRRWISPPGSRWRGWSRSDSGGPTPPSSKRRWRALVEIGKTTRVRGPTETGYRRAKKPQRSRWARHSTATAHPSHISGLVHGF